MDFRDSETIKLENDPEFWVGDMTTLNITQINGGVQNNVVPPYLEIVCDMRIARDIDHTEFHERVK